MPTYSLVVAGLPPVAFDRLRKESENRIAPGGKLVLTPNRASGSYAKSHADDLISRAHEVAAKLDEAERFATLLIYVDYGDHSTELLLEKFFPFSLPLGIRPMIDPTGQSKRLVN